MSLIKIQDAYLSFSNIEILNNATLYINSKERICLIGKNGVGKSTLLKVISKEQELDLGNIYYQKNIKISYLQQKNSYNLNLSVYEFLSSGFMHKKNHLNNKSDITDTSLIQKTKLNINQTVKIKTMINKIKVKKDALLSSLSGGLLRIVTLAYVLVQEPDILLLDEPTNHLDIKTVQWLEIFLKKFSGSILFVSHDRSFIQNICTRIIDLDRGKLVSWPGDYENFIKLKKESYRIEKIHKKLFDQKLSIEEKWIRKGIKARCTRNEGRIKNLKILREKHENYKKIENIKNIKINQIKNYFGKIVFKLEKINMLLDTKIIMKNFSSTIENGDKIGLIGSNGCGKSTLIKIILGKIQPDSGKIYTGPGVKIAYFDQNREILNPHKTILDNIDCGKEKIILNGKEQYLIGYLKNFLFKPNQIHSLVKTLSGGECNRLLLARLFLKPSNVLILDEPTNDLDLDTLQLLEKIIIDYSGTVIIVSHDRKFIENTVNKYWIFENNGFININLKHSQIKEKKINLNKISSNNTKKLTSDIIQQKVSKKIPLKNTKKEINHTLHVINKIESKIINLQNQLNQPNFFHKKISEKLLILKILEDHEKQLKIELKNWEVLENITH